MRATRNRHRRQGRAGSRHHRRARSWWCRQTSASSRRRPVLPSSSWPRAGGLHDLVLGVGQLAGLVEHLERHRRLAHVVQHAGHADSAPRRSDSSMPSWRPSDTISAHTAIECMWGRSRRASSGAPRRRWRLRVAPHRGGDPSTSGRQASRCPAHGPCAPRRTRDGRPRATGSPAPARCSSAPSSAAGGGWRAGGSASAHLAGRARRASPGGGVQRRGATPRRRREPFARHRRLETSIQTSLTPLAQLVEIGRVVEDEPVRQNGWSTSSPHRVQVHAQAQVVDGIFAACKAAVGSDGLFPGAALSARGG